MTDCLLIGFNEGNFGEFCSSIRELGKTSTAYRDIRTSVVTHEGAYLRALDVINEFRKKELTEQADIYHNMDFLSPAILYLGSFLQARGFSFDYINLFHLEKEQLKEKLRTRDVSAIVVTTTLYVTVEPILAIVAFIRQCDPDIKIIVGGPYILKETVDASSEDVQRLFTYIDADFYVMSSEGEQTLARILSAIKGDGVAEDIANCAYRSGNGFRVNPLIPEENLLEDTVIDYALFPARDLGEIVSIRTALSCPFSCAFCGFPKRAGRHRAADLSHVEKELNALSNLGHISTITFLDDSFNVPRLRFKEILQMMISNRYNFRWNSFLRCDHVDGEIVELMKEAGCEGVFIGAESGNDAMLQRMNKSVRRRHFMEIVPLFKKAGIVSHMSLVVGFPGETEESVRDTISLIEEAQPDFYRAQLWYCDPMTPIWDMRGLYGIRGAGFDWAHNSMTSRAAMDWVEEIFMSVSESIWLPQHGFELWSVFYLQRRGMTLEQVKQFLHCFNATVKEQMVAAGFVDLSAKSRENIYAVCSPGTINMPYPEVVRASSGAHYRKAEAFWKETFRALHPLVQTDINSSGGMEEKIHVTPLISIKAIEEVAVKLNVEERLLILSLFTALLSRLYGEFEVSVAILWDGLPAFPVSLHVCWSRSFQTHIDSTAVVMNDATAYAAHASYFLESRFHTWADRGVLSKIHAGLNMATSGNGVYKIGSLGENIQIQLNVEDNGGVQYLTLCTAESCMSVETAHDFVSYFNQALFEITENKNIVVASLLAGECEPHQGDADTKEDIEFQF